MSDAITPRMLNEMFEFAEKLSRQEKKHIIMLKSEVRHFYGEEVLEKYLENPVKYPLTPDKIKKHLT